MSRKGTRQPQANHAHATRAIVLASLLATLWCVGCPGDNTRAKSGSDCTDPVACAPSAFNRTRAALPDAGPRNIHRCGSDSDCDDGLFCNGAEHCSFDVDDDAGTVRPRDGSCQPAATQPCATNACNEASHQCDCDADHDGLAAWFCGGTDDDADGDGYRWNDPTEPDCDDKDRYIYPHQVEVCDYTGIDEDCDLTTVAGRSNDADPLRDKDKDGYVDVRCINKDPKTGELHHYVGDRLPDCNDDNNEIHPGPDVQDNTCDGVDNDCDGLIDEQAPRQNYCPDVDGDGWPAAGPIKQACVAEPGYLLCRTPADCDESPVSGLKVRPDLPEVCDGLDNDCNEQTPKDRAPPGKLLFDEPTFSDGTEATCDEQTGTWQLTCPAGRAWCDKSAISHGCETDITRLTRCQSCEPTDCGFACGSQGCDEVAQVALGAEFACAVTSAGLAACWGRGAEGRLGNDDPRSSSTPGAVVVISSVKSVSAGTAHACAIVGANNAVYCWGSNEFGQLANSDTATFSTAPLPVGGAFVGDTLQLQGAVQLAAADQHSCAVMQKHTVVCWGETKGGRLGQGIASAGTSIPTPVSRVVEQPPRDPVQVPVANAAQVAAGNEHSCLLTTDGNVECWGSNAVGQLAADPSLSESDYPLGVGHLSNVSQISAGAYHTCAVTSGRVLCWGLNNADQLGRASSENDYLPGEVAGLPAIAEVAAGADFSCARSVDGLVYCWGSNAGGQLGAVTPDVDGGEPEDFASPTSIRVESLVNVAHLATSQFACAIGNNSRVSCWGYNFFGQLGRGTTSPNAEPLPTLIRSLAGSTR